MTVTLTSTLLVLGCALAFSVTDLLRKVLGARVPPLPLLFFLSAGPTPVFMAWYLGAADWRVGMGYLAPGVASVALNVGSNLAFLEAVRIAPLSRTIPMLSLTPVFTTLLAVPLLGERPSSQQLAGVVVVVVGILWLQLQKDDARPGAGGRPDPRARRGSLMMIGVALLWSLAMPLDKLAMRASSPAFHGLALTLGVSLGVLGLLAARGEARRLRTYLGDWPLLALAVAATLAALVLQLLAVVQTWVGFVETMKRAVGSLMALVLGAALFGESARPAKVLAVVVIGVGVALVML